MTEQHTYMLVLPEQLWRLVKARAAEEGTTVRAIIERLLSAYVKGAQS